MKRSQDFTQTASSQPTPAPAAKKLKMSSPESPQVKEEGGPDGGWTKVEKRKGKKHKKLEEKFDVCVLYRFQLSVPYTQLLFM
jgi:hypothetical protein